MKLLATAIFFTLAAASPLQRRHTTLQYIAINGVDAPLASTSIRSPGTNAPVTSVTSADLTCNIKNVGVAGVIEAKAGDTVTTEYHHDNSRTSEFVDPSHKGPYIVYLAKVTSATAATGAGSVWFKIYEDGYTASTGKWATDRLNENSGKASFKLPSTLAAGDYLMRTEFIALQGAAETSGAQFYVGCAQFRITSSGTATGTGVAFPGYHKADHPGILFRLDTFPATGTYTIPGPTVWTG